MPNYYVIHIGRKPGIYSTWAQARQYVDNFKGAVYKKFTNLAEANDFLKYGFNYKNKDKEHDKDKDKDKDNDNDKAKKKPYSKVLNVYTDGSSINNHLSQDKRGAGMGIVFDLDYPFELSLPFSCGEKSNNRAELCAIINAIDIANEKEKYDPRFGSFLNIYTDSKYSILCATNAKKWKENDWNTSSGQPAKNIDLLIELQKRIDKRKVFFKHIRAHTNARDKDSRYNSRADALAVQAAEKNIGK